MSVRAGIVVTGTEVLAGRVQDRNGPWLAERLAELGVDLAYVTIVGDRPADMERALRFMADEGLDLVLTSGGLGPTADDLTAEVVGRFQGRAPVLDEALAERIEAIVRPLLRRWPNLDRDAIRAGSRKQATIPAGATVLEPVGTAPGLVVPPPPSSPSSPSSSPPPAPPPPPPSLPPAGSSRASPPESPPSRAPSLESQAQRPSVSGARDLLSPDAPRARATPTIVVLPGPPRELQPMWAAAIATDALRRAIAGATVYEQRTLRLFGIPESEIAETLRRAEAQGIALDRLEVTTCLKRGEVEVVTRYEPDAAEVYEQLEALIRERHADTLFSADGRTIDAQVADLLRGDDSRPARTIAIAESCTGGELSARLTAPAGASAYVLGGAVVYSNEAKVTLAGVDQALIERHGAVSEQVAQALAEGIRARLRADLGVGVTGIAGPGGGSAEKPVGLVWLSVAGPEGARLTRSVSLPGGRGDIRDRASTVALHLVRRLLLGEADS